ncbi:MAG: transglutaminase-like domain-containing protein [Symbiobacteriaceae bacterium]|nr:transglutaminase-like domain-containing protein [Symbiobacteriaceae bacterium]
MLLAKKILSLTLISCLLLFACTPTVPTAPPTAAPTVAPTSPPTVVATEASTGLPEELINISDPEIPLSAAPPVFTGLLPEASGVKVQSNAKAIIDYSNSADGYVMTKYVPATPKSLRVTVTGPSAVQYIYFLRSDGEYEVFPLSDGVGAYKIGVYESPDGGSKYALAGSLSLDVELTDEFAPFLRPNQYVNYNEDSKTVAKAAELVKDSKTIFDKIKVIYEYVIDSFEYDFDLAKSVQSGYLPDVDAVLEKGKGICFDYAAITTAMLRSQNIPCKLVVGYEGEVYHAWINVYNSETGDWINEAIFFDGESWKLIDPTYASTAGGTAGGDARVASVIGSGQSYVAKYLY